MPNPPSVAERLDRAIDAVLDGSLPAAAAAGAGLAPDDRGLVRTAAALHASLSAPIIGPRFEARLGSRLSGAAPWILRHPGRLIVTGAVGSAVGVGVTAYAVWRSTRRAGVRAVHR